MPDFTGIRFERTVVMKRIILVTTLLTVLGSGSASATTGNDLLKHCGASNEGDVKTAMYIAACTSYLSGVWNTLKMFEEDNVVGFAKCIPDGVTVDQVRDVVIKRLKDNPKDRHWYAAAHVMYAMAEAWPCPK
jgi:hypothetical protein